MNDQTLSLPRLFQASGKVLDLQNLNPPDPDIQGDQGDPVVVSVLLPAASKEQEDEKKQVTVWFGSKSKPFSISNPRLVVLDCLFQRNELPSPGASYDIYYEHGGAQSPSVSIQLIDSSCAAAVPRHAFTASGMWAAASQQIPVPVNAWLVPAARTLLKDDPIIKSVPEVVPDDDVALQVVRQPSGSQASVIGEIVFSKALGQWSVNLDDDSLSLQPSDLLLVQNAKEAAQPLGFSMTW